MIIAPPPAVAYPFILDVEGYPGQIINFFIVIGLFWLRYTKPNAPRPFKGVPLPPCCPLRSPRGSVLTRALVWWPFAVFFLAASVFRECYVLPVATEKLLNVTLRDSTSCSPHRALPQARERRRRHAPAPVLPVRPPFPLSSAPR